MSGQAGPSGSESKRWAWPSAQNAQDALMQQVAGEGWSSCFVSGNNLRCTRPKP